MAVTEPLAAALDEVIAACLREQTAAATDRLAALGPAGLRRAVALYYGHSTWVNPPQLGLSGRELVDAWSELLFQLAVAYPDVYLEEIESRRIRLTLTSSPISEVVILGFIDDSRAVALLVRCVRHKDWLVRYHAVRGLARSDDAAAIAAVQRAAREDCSVSVRVEAAAAVARRDPLRARVLFATLLEHPHLTPLLRKQVKAAIAEIDKADILRQ